jgi:putative phosphoesterase
LKLAVLADIHGNLPALEAVVHDMLRQGVTRILVAGDLTRGPDDNGVIRLLQTIPGWVIRGNTDRDLIELARGNKSEAWCTNKQYATIRWCLEHLEKDSLAYLQSLPEQGMAALSGRDSIHIVHGSPRNPNELLSPRSELTAVAIALAQIEERVLVCGHSHKSWQERMNGKLALNPGSVGLSTEGSPDARYAILTWTHTGWAVKHQQVQYDTGRIRRRFRESGFLEGGSAYARVLMLSAVSGIDILVPFLRHARAVSRNAGVTDLDAIPDELWDQAENSFEWPFE